MVRADRIHLDVTLPGASPSKLSIETEFSLGDPLAQPDQEPYHKENDDAAGGNTKDVGCHHAATANLLVVEEGVRVEALVHVRHEGQSKVASQDEDDPKHVNPQRRVRARDEDLEEGERAVQGMLGDILPSRVLQREPVAREQHDPEDNGDEEGVDDDGGVEERVQRLQRAREPVEQRAALEGVGQGVDGGDKEVEGYAPEGDDGEVGELAAGGRAPAEGVMRARPADGEEERREAVEGLAAARQSLSHDSKGSGTGRVGQRLTMSARHANSSHGPTSHDVTKRYDGSHRSLPNEKTFLNAMIAPQFLGIGRFDLVVG